jgi:hypothetical protein
MTDALIHAAEDITVRGAGLGLVGGIVVTGIAIGAILLWRSMNSRIRRLPATFDAPAAPAPSPVDANDPQESTDDGLSRR